jgi:hypothetical protein
MGKTNKMEKYMKSFVTAVFLVIGLTGVVSAQSNFKADQLQMVRYSGGGVDGSFEKTSETSWKESNNQDGTHFFSQTQLDDWSVYLKDEARSITIQIDLHQRSVFVDPFGGGRRKLYSITRSAAKTKRISIGSQYSFESFNYPGEYMRHQNYLGIRSVINSEPAKQSAIFRVVSGLSGNQCGNSLSVSFELVNLPGYYLRHQNSRIKLSQTDGSGLFNNDATFCVRPGLADPKYSSFESSNYPTAYLTHTNGELWLRKGTDNLFKADATFMSRAPLSQ